MSKKVTQPIKPNIPLELRVDRHDAKQKLTIQIVKGTDIRVIPISNEQELGKAENEYCRWNDFNKALLKNLFTSEELCCEYSKFSGSYIVHSLLSRRIDDFHQKIDEENNRLQSIIERLELIPEKAPINTSPISQDQSSTQIDQSKIFIVHGHDDSAKLEVARFIETIGFEPIILHEQASGHKTIIEKIETYSDVGFGVVIYTPCDIGGKQTDMPDLKGRARQNVVFEHGFLIGKLGRSKVCALVKGQVETPNDISGIVYTLMDSGNWKIDLSKELRAAEYPIDMNKII